MSTVHTAFDDAGNPPKEEPEAQDFTVALETVAVFGLEPIGHCDKDGPFPDEELVVGFEKMNPSQIFPRGFSSGGLEQGAVGRTGIHFGQCKKGASQWAEFGPASLFDKKPTQHDIGLSDWMCQAHLKSRFPFVNRVSINLGRVRGAVKISCWYFADFFGVNTGSKTWFWLLAPFFPILSRCF